MEDSSQTEGIKGAGTAPDNPKESGDAKAYRREMGLCESRLKMPSPRILDFVAWHVCDLFADHPGDHQCACGEIWV